MPLLAWVFASASSAANLDSYPDTPNKKEPFGSSWGWFSAQTFGLGLS